MPAKIDCYLDCVSPYSYFALKHLLEQREVLTSHDVEIEFFPVFLGGINVGSGNKPPWTLPAKAKYGGFDRERAEQFFDTKFYVPKFFPILSLLPQRCMLYVKDKFPRDKFEASFGELWLALWGAENLDISKPELLRIPLSQHFSEDEVSSILAAANDPKYKQKLLDDTASAVKDHGAFGCPWIVATNSAGATEPFFGSDRFHYMWQFLGVPVQKLAILPKQERSKI